MSYGMTGAKAEHHMSARQRDVRVIFVGDDEAEQHILTLHNVPVFLCISAYKS